jgi:hypothetical protein
MNQNAQDQEVLNKIASAKSAGFIGQLAAMGKSKEYIKQAHAAYKHMDEVRMNKRAAKYENLRHTILQGISS